MKSLLKLAVKNVNFKCNGIWYVQSDGLAMGASLAVILANVWMKSFEESLQKPELNENISISDQNGKCKDCNRRVTFRDRGVECESCKNWFHARCQKLSNEEYANMQDVVWICTYCNNQQIVGSYEEMKMFKRYVDDIIVVVVVVAKSLGIYHGFSAFMSLVSKFGMLVTVRALAEYPPGT